METVRYVPELRMERLRYADVVAPFAQLVLEQPERTEELIAGFEAIAYMAPHYSDPGAKTKMVMDVCSAVLGHVTAMRVLARIGSGDLHSSDTGQASPILERHMSTELYARRQRSVFSPAAEHQEAWDGFVGAMMDIVNPEVESLLRQLQGRKNGYGPVWDIFARLTHITAAAMEAGYPQMRAYLDEQKLDDPVSAFHEQIWGAAGSMPLSAFRWAPLAFEADDVRSVGDFQRRALDKGVIRVLAQSAEFCMGARRKSRDDDAGVMPEHYMSNPHTTGREWGGLLARSIRIGASACPGIYGLTSPDPVVRRVCSVYNEAIGLNNRTGGPACPADNMEAVSSAEVFAYLTLLVAPSTLWRGFLDSRGAEYWGDALPGTLLPNEY